MGSVSFLVGDGGSQSSSAGMSVLVNLVLLAVCQNVGHISTNDVHTTLTQQSSHEQRHPTEELNTIYFANVRFGITQ